ncbi:MAG: UDP-N-acetylmuramoyl-tripeptide--D-alanyl-D-alanine ligase [Flavobacteriaceae bacterium]|nr:UDP-N-acetylmuramoyl-tripeptide--D-alanyl-D-alanine ligase [Flavobacteriaceae bacterium]
MHTEALYDLFLTCDKVNTDSRKITDNCMFFALKGENFDGNQYAINALDNGASFAVIDDASLADEPKCIFVDDTLKSLQELANHHRHQLKAKLIALTGSNGKTTTKELIYRVLSTKFKTQCTHGNFNNHIGVPLTLLSIKEDTEFAIVEMGANHLKEIELLCNIADPDYGYITNFGKAHLEGFGSIEGVIKGKSELYDHLKNKGKFIFVNARDPKQVELTSAYDKCIEFNKANGSGLDSQFISADPFVKFDIDGDSVESQLTGFYNFHNISVAVAIGKYFEVSNENIKSAISNYSPENNRSQIIERDAQKIILDAYNANPTSMKAALDNFDQMSSSGKVAVLGDMFELGDFALTEHQAIADYAQGLSIDQLWLVGENFFGINTADSRCKTFRTYKDLEAFWTEHQSSYNTFLIKGSRGMALERLLNSE